MAAAPSLAIAKNAAPANSRKPPAGTDTRTGLARRIEPEHSSRTVMDVLTTDVARALQPVRGVSIAREFAAHERGFLTRKCRSLERDVMPVFPPGVT